MALLSQDLPPNTRSKWPRTHGRAGLRVAAEPIWGMPHESPPARRGSRHRGDSRRHRWAACQTLVHCSFASPDGFNASLVTGTATSDVTRQVQNRLVEFELGTTNIVPALAESWEISSNGAVYTFNLRQGVKFHTTKNFTPSREFNADDVLYSWNRMWKAGHPDHMLGGGTYETFTSNNLPELSKSIDKIDDHTVRFVLNRPEAPFIAMLTGAFAATHYANYAPTGRNPRKHWVSAHARRRPHAARQRRQESRICLGSHQLSAAGCSTGCNMDLPAGGRNARGT